MADVVALGELLIDFTQISSDDGGYPTLEAHPGGAPGNFLAALAKYGIKTALIGKVGRDQFGDMLCRTLKEAGISTAGLIRSPEVFTTLAFVTLDPQGERSFSFARKPGADTCLTFEEVDLDLIDQARAFHFGTLSLTHDPAKTATVRAVEYAKIRGKLMSFDPNLRKPLWDDLDRARNEMLWGISRAHVVKLSDEEVDFLWGCNAEEGANRLIEEYGVRMAMVTMGGRGCYLKNKVASCRIAPPPVTALDTTGAGDIFGGSALSGILEMDRDPAFLNELELQAVGFFASTAASLSTTRRGGLTSVPDRAEVVAHMRGCRIAAPLEFGEEL